MPFTTPAIDFVTWGIKQNDLYGNQNDKKQALTDFFLSFGLLQHAVTQYSIYLVHRNCSLDPCCHGFYPGAHPQVVHRLVLLSDGVLCMDPCHFHVPLLDSLEVAQSGSVKIFGGQHQPVGFNHVLLSESATYFLDFKLLCFFFFITFLGISLEVFGSKL